MNENPYKLMMSFHEYYDLPDQEQRKQLLLHGTGPIATRYTVDNEIKLWSIGNFYVEVWRSNEHDRVELFAFKSVGKLEEFTKEIELDL